jgi:hypothetical protein
VQIGVSVVAVIHNKAPELQMGWRTFSTTKETALPKIKSENDDDSVF